MDLVPLFPTRHLETRLYGAQTARRAMQTVLGLGVAGLLDQFECALRHLGNGGLFDCEPQRFDANTLGRLCRPARRQRWFRLVRRIRRILR